MNDDQAFFDRLSGRDFLSHGLFHFHFFGMPSAVFNHGSISCDKNLATGSTIVPPGVV
jgi:hypothetical protein